MMRWRIKEQCHNPHYPTIRHLSRNWPSELPRLSSAIKFCYHVQSLANFRNTGNSFRSITSCLNIKGCKSFTTNNLYSSPGRPVFRICTCVQSSAPIAHGNANLFCQSSLAAWTTVANILETVLWWIPISSPTPVWKPGSLQKHLHLLLIA